MNQVQKNRENELKLPYLETNTYMSEKPTKPGELPDLQS